MQRMFDILEIRKYALSVANEFTDEFGSPNLTMLDEDVQDHFNMTDEEYEDWDISFLIFKALYPAKSQTGRYD